ncbi:MAG: DEAD/DEAH box helicase [Phycisphaerae bacterium]|nr:DEAD/DEAH box helicase [Phycisphaerae bacterium]
MSDTFEALGLGTELVTELASLGYEEPTPIQKAAIPPLLAGRDLLGQAATGTGKTAAFALPILQLVGSTKPESLKPLALVLVPTRELAVQVCEACHRYGKGLGIAVAPIYGGQEFHRQVVALRRGVHVVVATPGRALDHMRRGTLDLSGLRIVALDEADEMLDMGFAEDLELILEGTPEARQTALFSATLPPRIASIAEKHLRDPERILIARDAATKGSVPKVRQTAYIVPRPHKIAALGRVLDLESPTLALVFCRTRLEVDELAERLVGRGYRVASLHGGMGQAERDRVMARARAGTVDLLVATDVAARGIDIDHLTHVVNFDVPSSPEAYVHRIGRTGRAGREGVAISLVEPRGHRLLRNIEQATKQKISIATVPSPMDVKARRLDMTKGAVREVLESGDLEAYRSVAEALASEFDPMDVAAAAVRLAHEALEGDAARDEADIPVIEGFGRNDRPRREPSVPADAGQRASRGWQWSGPRPDGAPQGGERVQDRGAPRGGAAPRGQWQDRPPQRGAPRGQWNDRDPQDMERIFIGLGRKAGVRPADVVGAIANEANVNPRGIGDIEIAELYTIVELPARDVDHVVRVLRGATIRGRKAKVNRDLGIRK